MLISLIGYCTLIAVAWLCSCARSKIRWRTIAGAVAIQFGFGALVLYVPAGKAALEWLSNLVAAVIGFGNEGISFLFANLVDANLGIGFIFAFKVLPVIIFFSALISVLYYIKIMPLIVKAIGGGIQVKSCSQILKNNRSAIPGKVERRGKHVFRAKHVIHEGAAL